MNSVERWLVEHLGASSEKLQQLEQLHQAIVTENDRQNLIARSTIAEFWNRHILDSAQLLTITGNGPGRWIDLGSGAGFPGIVVAILSTWNMTLSEERRKRADHLDAMINQLGIGDRTQLLRGRVEQQQTGPYEVISARAFAPLDRLWGMAHHLASRDTLWVLPKGRSAASELEAASRTWQGRFRIEPSLTDPDGAIIVASDVQPRRRP